MRIFIHTLGTRGDIQPFIALGRGLMAVGHEVTLCTSSSFGGFVESHGLRYAHMNNDLIDLLNSDVGRDLIEHVTGVPSAIRAMWQVKKQVPAMNRRMIADSWQAVAEARPDFLLFHPKAFAAPDFAEKLGIPCAVAALQPFFPATREFPCMGFPEWKLGGRYNLLTYQFVRRIAIRSMARYANEWRREHGLAPRPPEMGITQDAAGRPIPVLHAFSQHVVRRPADWPDTVHQTGYWFLDRQEEWTPPAALLDFLAAGPAPVCVGFGSMAGRRPEQLAAMVLEAVRRAGVRAVLLTGWGGLAAGNLPAEVFKLDQAPHDWLYPRMAGVVHHGGAGTTAASLRAGCPTLVCPFILDQFFWGKRVFEMGVGPRPIPQKKLTVGALAEGFRALANDTSMRAAAGEIGARLQAEDGIAAGIAAITSIADARATGSGRAGA